MTEVRPYPIDLDALEKGVWISPDDIAEAMSVSRGDIRFPLARLRLREHIRTHWKGADGKQRVEVRQDREGLRLLLDAEVADYNAQRRAKVVREVAGCVRRITECVNDAALDDKQRRLRDHEANASATLAMFIARAHQQVGEGPKKIG